MASWYNHNKWSIKSWKSKQTFSTWNGWLYGYTEGNSRISVITMSASYASVTGEWTKHQRFLSDYRDKQKAYFYWQKKLRKVTCRERTQTSEPRDVVHRSQTGILWYPASGKFYHHLKLHRSQTVEALKRKVNAFYHQLKLHRSQTTGFNHAAVNKFYHHLKLHRSQTDWDL